MRAARLAGIRIFATGGIGGVHRGAAQSFDVSSDIDELAHLGSWPPTAEQLRVAMRTGSRVGGLVARVEGAQGRVADEASLSAGEAQ
jgi:hypothetical protein